MGTVGGPRHSNRPPMPGMAWQCGICGFLVVDGEVCPQCQDNPNWINPVLTGMAASGQGKGQLKPLPQRQSTGVEHARAAMQQLGAQFEPEAPAATQLDLRVSITIEEGKPTTVFLSGPAGEVYSGQGVTTQEAVIDALAAMEEDQNRPKCPTCGQAWPEDREWPSGEGE